MTESTVEAISPDMTTIKGIHHVGLSVSNLEESLTFYQSATPLELAGRSKISEDGEAEKAAGFFDAPNAVAVLKGPNAYLELMEFDAALSGNSEGIAVEGPGFTHVCYQSPTPNDLYSKFRARNASMVSRGDSPVDLNGRGVYYAYIRDSDQIMFEVEHLDQTKFEGPIWIAHIALVTHDIDRLVDFYEGLLGVAPYGRNDQVGGKRIEAVTNLDNARIRAAWFNAGNMVLELWEYTNPITQKSEAPLPYEKVGYNKFVLEVGDLKHEYSRMQRSEVQLLSEPAFSGDLGEVYARDPDGNLFGLIQLPSESPLSVDRLQAIDWM
jgi:catechol 2,3-dioxygenase-like lactoylglutathione lyase family enzyme